MTMWNIKPHSQIGSLHANVNIKNTHSHIMEEWTTRDFIENPSQHSMINAKNKHNMFMLSVI